MKNIRILEDGNRLIVVLEGYERSAVSALAEMLGTAAAPLSHIRPHTGEADFRLKGTEKEVPLPKQNPDPETPIKPPAFMEQLQADKAQMRQAQQPKQEAVAVPEMGVPETESKSTAKQPEKVEKPAKPGSGCTAGKQKENEEGFIPPELPSDPMPIQEHEMEKTAENTAERDGTAKVSKAVETDEAVKKEGTEASIYGMTTDMKAPGKPAEFMDSFELRAYIQQADKEKLYALLRKKGRFPNAMHLLNSDDRTIRAYVKEMLLTA